SYCQPFVLACHAPASTELYPLSLHDALPISAPDASQEEWMAWVNQAERGTIEWQRRAQAANEARRAEAVAMKEGEKDAAQFTERSEEHTSELQSRENLVCRLLLEKKKNNQRT